MYFFGFLGLQGALWVYNVEKPLMCPSTTTALHSTQNVLLSPRKTISFLIFSLCRRMPRNHIAAQTKSP